MATQTQRRDTKSNKPAEALQTVEKDAKPFRAFLTKFNNDGTMMFAGVLAYNFLMAMLPIFIAFIGIVGLIVGSKNSEALAAQITTVFPGLAQQQNAINLAVNQLQKDAGVLILIAVLLAAFGGSRLFVVIEQFLDLIYRVRPRPAIPQNLVALGMLVLFIVLIPIMVFASSLPTLINALLNYIPFLKGNIVGSAILGLAGILTGVLVSFILFEAIYIIVPNQKISFRHSWLGALVAAVLLELFLSLFPLYIRYFLKGYSGPIGFAVILLLFFYYFAVILLLGAEVNAFFSERVQPIPNDLVTFVSTMAGKLNKDRPDAESPSHMNTRPTDRADTAHIADARKNEGRNQQKNARKQQQVASQALAEEHVKATTKAKQQAAGQGPSKVATVLEVAAGTAITVVIELLRLRGRRRV